MSRSIMGAVLLGGLLLTSSAMAQTRTPFQAGVHWGFNFSDGEVDDERIGLQASVPVSLAADDQSGLQLSLQLPRRPDRLLRGVGLAGLSHTASSSLWQQPLSRFGLRHHSSTPQSSYPRLRSLGF